MALINCPECKEEVSSTARFCPRCGYEINNTTKTLPFKIVKWLFIIFNVVMLIWLISYLRFSGDAINSTHSSAEVIGASLGSVIGTGVITSIWIIGDIILGIALFFFKSIKLTFKNSLIVIIAIISISWIVNKNPAEKSSAGWVYSKSVDEINNQPEFVAGIESEDGKAMLIAKCDLKNGKEYNIMVGYDEYMGSNDKVRVRYKYNSLASNADGWLNSEDGKAIFAPAPIPTTMNMLRFDTFTIQTTDFENKTQTARFKININRENLQKVYDACYGK